MKVWEPDLRWVQRGHGRSILFQFIRNLKPEIRNVMPGTPEILVIFLLVLVLFGPDKLPDLARQVGRGVRKIRNASDELKSQLNLDMLDDEFNDKK